MEDKKEVMQQSPRKVMIGTPTIDGKIHAEYFTSYIESSNILSQYNIILFPEFRAYDTLIQRARNDLIQDAINFNVDDLVFIDSDIGWTSEQLMRLLSHEVDLVGGTYPRKQDEESYVVKVKDGKIVPNEDGLIEVNGLGCGFTRMTKRCFNMLYEISEKYEDNYGNRNKMVFSIDIINGIFTSEDISLCHKWQELGEKVWFDPFITCSHIGTKTWYGNFDEWIRKVDINNGDVWDNRYGKLIEEKKQYTGADIL